MNAALTDEALKFAAAHTWQFIFYFFFYLHLNYIVRCSF